MADNVRDMLPLMLEARRFFRWGVFGGSSDLCPVQRGILSRFTINYYTLMNSPERIAGDLIGIIHQCE